MSHYTIEEIRAKSDQYIFNTVNQAENYDPELVKVAQIVYDERDLGSTGMMDTLIEQRKKRIRSAKSEISALGVGGTFFLIYVLIKLVLIFFRQ